LTSSCDPGAEPDLRTGRPIVVAVDGSDGALSAVGWAAAEARRRGEPLRIVAVPSMPPRMRAHEGSRRTVANALYDAALSSVREAAARATDIEPSVIVDTDVLPGAPAIAVTDAGCGASMLVVGARGIGGVGTVFLGSVSDYVAANASCPIVVVHDKSADARNDVVVGVRDLEDPDRALAFAFEEAAMREASLIVLHAWYWFPSALRIAGDTVADAGLVSAQARRQLAEDLAAWQGKYPEVTVEVDVVRGHAGRVLAAASADAQLLVLGRHDGGLRLGMSAGYASVQHSVLGRAHCPVAVIPA